MPILHRIIPRILKSRLAVCPGLRRESRRMRSQNTTLLPCFKRLVFKHWHDALIQGVTILDGYNNFTTIYAVPTHPVPKTLGNPILHFSVIKWYANCLCPSSIPKTVGVRRSKSYWNAIEKNIFRKFFSNPYFYTCIKTLQANFRTSDFMRKTE